MIDAFIGLATIRNHDISYLIKNSTSINVKANCENEEALLSLFLHTVRNFHFLSENSTLIFRENCRFFLGEKLEKMLWF